MISLGISLQFMLAVEFSVGNIVQFLNGFIIVPVNSRTACWYATWNDHIAVLPCFVTTACFCTAIFSGIQFYISYSKVQIDILNSCKSIIIRKRQRKYIWISGSTYINVHFHSTGVNDSLG